MLARTALALLLFTAAPAGAADFRVSLSHGGRDRVAYVHVPPTGTAPRPVVLNLHGGGSEARAHRDYARMDEAADRHGFVAAYPNGTGPGKDRLLTWNAGTCCGSAAAEGVDDVGFLLALVDEIGRHTEIDPTRVYATGLSNGAMMAYRLAAEASERIAAIAPVAGSMMLAHFAPARPVPVIHFHSVDDGRAPYAGGLGPPLPSTKARVLHPAVADTLARWVTADGCPPQPAVSPTIIGGGVDTGQTATRYDWGPCRDGIEIVHWKLTGAGHVWPGGTRDYLTRRLGPSTALVDANEEMWKFFEQFETK